MPVVCDIGFKNNTKRRIKVKTKKIEGYDTECIILNPNEEMNGAFYIWEDTNEVTFEIEGDD